MSEDERDWMPSTSSSVVAGLWHIAHSLVLRTKETCTGRPRNGHNNDNDNKEQQ